MTFQFNVHVTFTNPFIIKMEGCPAADSHSNRILNIVTHLAANQRTIMTDLTTLTAEVAEIKTVSESAIVLINGLKAALDAAGTDPVKLKELSDSLDASGNALAAAVAANTPTPVP